MMITKPRISQAKYIKLGTGGSWTELSLNEGTLRLGYHQVPHELGLTGDIKAIKEIYLKKGRVKTTASNHARQVLDFYQADETTVWITFHKGLMYWCQAYPDVEFLGSEPSLYPYGSRLRRTIGGWKNAPEEQPDHVFRQSELSGHLTRTAAYQQTICDIKHTAFDYLKRKLEGRIIPQVEEAQHARGLLHGKLVGLISLLTWQDFELFVDLIFSQAGWQRTHQLGRTQKDIDAELINPLTGERALVQVKSQTSQAELEDYIERLQAYQSDKTFYIYHTGSSEISLNNNSSSLDTEFNLIGPEQLADQAIRLGLVDWLLIKTG